MARVLIIEDDGDIQRLLSLALYKEGYEVHYAFNGKEGFDKIVSLSPDVILLDLVMPVLSGVEVAKMVSADPALRAIPIIVMTGHAEQPEMLESAVKAQGVREYLRKPFEINDLVKLIARIAPREGSPSGPKPNQIAKGAVRLDTLFRKVWIGGKLVATLSPNKTEVLKILLEADGPVKREKLLSAVWGSLNRVGALEKTIQRLREDLGPANGERIQTTPDGYRLISDMV